MQVISALVLNLHVPIKFNITYQIAQKEHAQRDRTVNNVMAILKLLIKKIVIIAMHVYHQHIF